MRVLGLTVTMAAVVFWASQASADIKCRVPSPDSDAFGRQLLSECLAREGMTREEWDAQFPPAPQTQNVQQTERPWPRSVPEDLRVDTFLCNGVPFPQVEFLAQLPQGGDWSLIGPNAFLYAVVRHDPVIGNADDLRYVFEQTEGPPFCPGQRCGALTKVAMNGRYLSRDEMKSACFLLGQAAVMMKATHQ
ncbi:hypothetical protein [Rhodospirillum sp. A1_3_36]|uniref:hypothetical protein n=1 Tax=Rhodospirillum sp. A1_3_36 TaxID=3391666 RepID=UPI0039A5540F